jgi:hypothetical protein
MSTFTGAQAPEPIFCFENSKKIIIFKGFQKIISGD